MIEVSEPTTLTEPADQPIEKTGKLSMILGIVGAAYGITLGWLFPLPAVALGILGLIVRKDASDSMSTAGLVLGIINTSLGALATVWWVLVVVLVAAGSSSGY